MSVREEIRQLREQLRQNIIGQEHLVDRLLIALLADGHLLVEGAPGLAKTRAIRALGERIQGDFQRIQFTPDLLPADLTGTEIFRPQDGSFSFQQGPLFHNLILADEINRAPAKVQSALLEAMAERQITVGKATYALPRLYLVMATRNPIEQEGTYPLPEAQLDRFLMQVNVGYPPAQAEKAILHLCRREALDARGASFPPLPQESIFSARQECLELYMSEALEDYLIQLVLATREPRRYGEELGGWVRYGASPRATLALDRCSRAHAWLAGREFVTPEDIQAVCFDVLRHRIILSYEAEVEGIGTERFVSELLARVAIP